MVKMAAKKTTKKSAGKGAKNRIPKEITPAQKRNMEKIVSGLQDKLNEMEKWKKALDKRGAKPISPQQSKAMLEEIKVPKLPVIKER